MTRKCFPVFLATLWLVCSPVLGGVDVVFRYDDLTLNPNGTDRKIVELFNELNVPLSIAVIPCDSNEKPIPSTDSTLLTLLQSNNFEIAHGLTHQDLQRKGEFGGLNETETYRRIHKGKQILESATGKKVNTFIPPYNAINAYVPAALQQDSISIMSADMFNAIRGDIQYYPETLGHLMEQMGIWHAARTTISQCQEADAVCVVMFHAYDLSTDDDWQQLRDLLAYCKASPTICLFTFSTLQASGRYANYMRYRANQLESGLQKYFLQHGVLHSTWLCVAIHLLNALLYTLLALLFGFLCCRKLQNTRFRNAAMICFIVIGTGSFLLAWFHILGPLKLLAISITANGICSVLYIAAVMKSGKVR